MRRATSLILVPLIAWTVLLSPSDSFAQWRRTRGLHSRRNSCCTPCRPVPISTAHGSGTPSATPNPNPPAATPASASTPPSTLPATTSPPPAAAATAPPAATDSASWESLFDGETLQGWESTNFGGEGNVDVEDGAIVLQMGTSLTGITRTGSVPTGDYELELEAQRVEGRDFFCGLTFPAKDSHCSLIVGGWGGGLVGISSIDGYDASENNTTTFQKFESHRWYKIRVQVTSKTLTAWIDDNKVIDRSIEKNRLTVRGEVEASRPLGIASYETRAAIRNIRWRKL